MRGDGNGGEDTQVNSKKKVEEEKGQGEGEEGGGKGRIKKSLSCSALSCVSLNEEHGPDTKGSEGKQCRLTRHHWVIISNLLWHNFPCPCIIGAQGYGERRRRFACLHLAIYLLGSCHKRDLPTYGGSQDDSVIAQHHSPIKKGLL